MKFLHFILVCFSFALLAYLSACDSLVQDVPDSRVPQEPEKPVVVSFISPQDSLLAVSVKRTQTVLGVQQPNNQGVINAIVTMSEGNRFIAFSYVQGTDGIYSAPAKSFPIEPGKLYTLTVKMPTGQTLTSSATVPNLVPITNILLDSTRAINGGPTASYNYHVRIGWKDVAGIQNYYRIVGSQLSTQTIVTGPANQTQTLTQQLPVRFNSEANRYLITDRYADGNDFTSSKGHYQRSLISVVNGKQQAIPAGPVIISLLNTDKMYHDYHEALNRYSDADGNPFAEPVLLPSNIQGGGLGCFAAYNRATFRIDP